MSGRNVQNNLASSGHHSHGGELPLDEGLAFEERPDTSVVGRTQQELSAAMMAVLEDHQAREGSRAAVYGG